MIIVEAPVCPDDRLNVTADELSSIEQTVTAFHEQHSPFRKRAAGYVYLDRARVSRWNLRRSSDRANTIHDEFVFPSEQAYNIFVPRSLTPEEIIQKLAEAQQEILDTDFPTGTLFITHRGIHIMPSISGEELVWCIAWQISILSIE